MKTILIVEDDDLSMKLLTDLLQPHGYRTMHSVDGMDTTVLMKERRPDLILMDIQLPRVSGLEHARMLKADDDWKDIPIIAVTALAMKGDKEKILEAGCDAYITKPITAPNLLQTIADHIE